MDIDGFVTAGGRSSRMGRDKSWLELGGRPMIERVIAALGPVASRISIIANSGEYSRLGLPVFADVNIGIGPLEAIRVAMANSRAPRFALVGCDLPFVTSELFAFLLDLAGDYQAVVPVGADGGLEPLCAIYSTEAIETVETMIESGERKPGLLFERIHSRRVAFSEISHLRGAALFFENVNSPADYRRVVERVADMDADGA